MLNIPIRHKAKQFSKLVRESAITRRAGDVYRPVLAKHKELGITFIGHSSFFIQIAGNNIVIDPNFGRWLVVLKRLRRPGTRIKYLPPIDYVLVTHAHMDHLHKPSLRAIARASRQLCGKAPVLVIPKDVRDLVRSLGYTDIVELEWWQQYKNRSLTITQTPAQHWGARMLKDFHRGFGGYVIRGGKDSLYHAGDTAYFDGFREIGERLHPEIALLPIGAYDPPAFRNVHTSPEDALRGFLDMKARWMIPMHYGSFRLSHEPMAEPVERLLEAAADAGVEDKMVVLQEGVTQFFRPDKTPQHS